MGCGRVGSTLAQLVEDRGHTVAVVDQNPDASAGSAPASRDAGSSGVGFDRDTLLEAGIEEAFAFAAVSSGDNSNILAARVARETFGVSKVVARIYDPGRAEVYQRLGIPTVATVRWTADQMARRLLSVGATPEYRDASGTVVLAEVQVHLGWVGRRMTTLEGTAGGRVAFLTRLGEGLVPGPDTVYQEGDLVHIVIRETELEDAQKRARRAAGGGAALMRVVIAGAGSVGRSIARELLANGHDVLLIDKDPHAIRVDQRPDAQWLLADACEIATLEEAGLADCDVVVAASGDDKVNLVVSLLSKTEYGVPRTVARVNNPANEWMFDEAWGVDVAVSTPRLMTALVEEAVSIGDLVRIFTFQQSQATMVELTLPANSPVVGSMVGDVVLPADTVLVCILREERPIAPSRDDTLEANDELMFVTVPESEDELQELLSPGRPRH